MDEAVEAAEGIFGEPVTPAHYLGNQNDLNKILEAIMSGEIPHNTKQPYPVIWKADIEQLQKQQYQNQFPNYRQPPFDPPYRQINGVDQLF